MTIEKTSPETVATEDWTSEGYMPEWRRRIKKKRKIKYITKLSQIPQLGDEERERMEKVTDFFKFRTNSYYLSLINWDDPDDPIKNLILPDESELVDQTSLLDASLEAAVTVAPGTEHKYTTTGVILVSRVCGGQCRFCFRKRIFMKDNTEITPDLEPAYKYIENHPEITNVLLTGGDAFLLSTHKIAEILKRLRSIPHVRIVRFGSKLPAFNPYRFIDDPDLLDLLESYSKTTERVYIVCQFNHSNELSDVARQAIDMLLKRGIIMINQTPILVGINDNPDALVNLFRNLAQTGIPPYYVFQCRPTRGNAHFKTTIIEGIDITEAAKKRISGLGKRFRYAGSHASGKIEILGYDDKWLYFKYHQSKDPKYYGQFFKLPRKDDAKWWDDWMPKGESFTLDSCPAAELGSGTI
jgi:lysine 2,3-aminomutase